MLKFRFTALPTDIAESYRSGQPDANGRPAEKGTADEQGGLPCRHCLRDIGAGEEYLLFAHRPFAGDNPYSEVGPIFLHADGCERHQESGAIPVRMPEVLAVRPQLLARGYDANDRIVDGTGKSMRTEEFAVYAAELLARSDIAYLHLRSAVNSCFTCRVDRA